MSEVYIPVLWSANFYASTWHRTSTLCLCQTFRRLYSTPLPTFAPCLLCSSACILLTEGPGVPMDKVRIFWCVLCSWAICFTELDSKRSNSLFTIHDVAIFAFIALFIYCSHVPCILYNPERNKPLNKLTDIMNCTKLKWQRGRPRTEIQHTPWRRKRCQLVFSRMTRSEKNPQGE